MHGKRKLKTWLKMSIFLVGVVCNTNVCEGDDWYIVVDDMESYNNTDNKIKDTWRDYWYQSMNPPYIPTGAVLDLGEQPQDPVHGGSQSMKYQYVNILWGTPGHPDAYAGVCYSEAWLPIPAELQDWTAGGAGALRLYFYGDADNDVGDGERMYVGLKDVGGKYAEVRYGVHDPTYEDMNYIGVEQWFGWDISLPHFSDANFASVVNDVNLSAISELYIGFGDRRNPICGGEGVVMFDDIQLYPPQCIPWLVKPVGDLDNNCFVDFRDFAILANQWMQPAGSPSADIAEPPDGWVKWEDLGVLAECWLEEKLWPTEP
jgi:hypothetical protein